MEIRERIKKYKDYIVEMRRYFHQYPEKSNEEIKTSKKIKEELEKMGIPYKSVANTGVIGTIKGSKPGKTIALRADIDGLAVVEKNDVDYKSKVDGMMHACGHDGHIAMLLGAARLLNDMKDDINGTVRLIFQPAEEVAQGAKVMIAEGALDGVDGIFGMHLWGDLECGKVSVEEGPVMSAADIFKIKVKGKGGHGSLPHQGIDAVVVASAIVMNLQTIASREINPIEPVVISIGSIKSGTRFNVIASEAVLEGTSRCFNPELREDIPKIMERIIKHTAETYRAEASLEYTWGMPVSINNKECSKLAKDAVKKILGEDGINSMPKLTIGEDMSEYLNIVPGAIALVGSKNENKECIYPNHHGNFDIDEDSLEIGAALHVQYVLEYLNQ
ncbi:MAG: M20 family metallopeptidase [Peptostreptococcaceae bacterium]|nr:M20 family metallopeptidase [Peptostreptococcaceae bacterium]